MTDYTIVLSTRDQVLQGAISNVSQDSINVVHNLNAANEISFDVYKVLDGFEEPRWEQLKVLKLIYVVQLDEYFEIDISYKDALDEVMSITGKSLCESELDQIMLFNIEINTEADILRDDYETPTVLYNPENRSASLLHRILDKAPHYTIGHVDSSIAGLQRTFSLDNISIYSFLSGECSEQFNCLFQFDTTARTINAYDLYTVCEDCDTRGDFVDTCPKCGGHHLKYFGEDTLIYVDKENLTDEVSLTTETGKIKNSLKLKAGDDYLTATVIGLNPNGSDYLYYFNEDTLEDMPVELVSRLNQYNERFDYYQNEHQVVLDNVLTYNDLVNKYNAIITEQASYCGTVDPIPNTVTGYPRLTQSLYSAIDFRLILNSSLMPGRSKEGISAESEAEKIYIAYSDKDKSSKGALSPVAQSSVTDTSSYATAEATIKNFSKIFVKSGYVKIDLHTTNGEEYNEQFYMIDDDGNHFKLWQGYYKITNYSDEEDVVFISNHGVVVPTYKTHPSSVEAARIEAESDPMTIKIYDNYQEFMTQRVEKKISTEDSDDGSIYEMVTFSIVDEETWEIDPVKVANFKKALTYYSLSRLTSFYDTCMAAMDVLVDSLPTLQHMYDTYYQKSIMCSEAIDNISKDIAVVDQMYSDITSVQSKIKKELNVENFLGEDLYTVFCMYRREDTYENSNYTSTGLTTTELFEKAQEFLEVANKEMVKAGTPQHEISANLYNLLQIKEFEPIQNHFQLGNWIRVRAGETVYRLRLISYTEKNDDDTNISVEFSDVTVAGGIVNDIASILASAQSMASSYGYVQNQASSGKSTADAVMDSLTADLTSSNTIIKNNTNEEVVIDELGITGRSFNDEEGEYYPEQFRITHNLLAFTDDNWETVKLALGQHKASVYEYNTETQKIEQVDVVGYGLSAKFVSAGYVTGSHVYGSEFIGGEIYSDNYSSLDKRGTHINLNDGTFSLAGGKFSYDGKDLLIEGSVIKESMLEMEGISLTKDENNKFEFTKANGLYIVGGVINLGASDGKSYLHLANGSMDIYGLDSERSVKLGSIEAGSGLNDNSNKTGLCINPTSSATYISIGNSYTINLGENPSGLTYKNIFNGEVFSSAGFYTTDLHQERIGKPVLNEEGYDYWFEWDSVNKQLELFIDGASVGRFAPINP